MHKITAMQARAARAYLDWSQEQLASAAAVSLSTVRSFESGVTPRASTINQIRKTFENAGIEFTEDEGIKWQPNEMRIFSGPDSYDKLFDDMVQEIKGKGGDILLLARSKKLLTKSYGDKQQTNIERLEQAHKIAPVKCIVIEDMGLSFAPPSFPLRMLTDNMNGPMSFYVYGGKYVAIHQDRRMNPLLMVLNIAGLAQEYRGHFRKLWENTVPMRLQSVPQAHRSNLISA